MFRLRVIVDKRPLPDPFPQHGCFVLVSSGPRSQFIPRLRANSLQPFSHIGCLLVLGPRSLGRALPHRCRNATGSSIGRKANPSRTRTEYPFCAYLSPRSPNWSSRTTERSIRPSRGVNARLPAMPQEGSSPTPPRVWRSAPLATPAGATQFSGLWKAPLVRFKPDSPKRRVQSTKIPRAQGRDRSWGNLDFWPIHQLLTTPFRSVFIRTTDCFKQMSSVSKWKRTRDRFSAPSRAFAQYTDVVVAHSESVATDPTLSETVTKK